MIDKFETRAKQASAYWGFSNGLSNGWATNATDRPNACCVTIEEGSPGQLLRVETEHWLPTIVNLGFTYRWRNK